MSGLCLFTKLQNYILNKMAKKHCKENMQCSADDMLEFELLLVSLMMLLLDTVLIIT